MTPGAIYHHTDNSGRFRDHWNGWDDYYERMAPAVERFGVGISIRQPFPTESTDPLHVDGWLQTADRKELWHDGFIKCFDRLHRITNTPPFIYLGHPGGDATNWPASNENRPYAPPPVLTAYLNEGVNRYIDGFNRCVSPVLQAGNNTSILCFDGSSSIRKDSPAFGQLNALRLAMAHHNRPVCIESPYNIDSDHAHLQGFGVGATFASFENRAERGLWDYYPNPRFVFIDSPWPKGLTKDEAYRLSVQRIKKVWEHGGIALVSLIQPYRDGFNAVDEWMQEYST